MRRHLITGLTLLALVGLVTAAAFYGWQLLFAPAEERDPAGPGTPTCTPVGRDGKARVRARDVTVSVFNAGSVPGLAADTRDRLERRGFRPGEVGNAPDDINIRFVQVWSSVRNDPAARLVALQFGPDTVVRYSDDDLGEGIDVIVGDRFRGFRKKVTRVLVIGEPENPCPRPGRRTPAPEETDSAA